MALPQVCNAAFNLETVLHLNLGRSQYVNDVLKDITTIGEIIDWVYDEARAGRGGAGCAATRASPRGPARAEPCARVAYRRLTTWSRG